MPWKQTQPDRVVRPCCGAWITVQSLWSGPVWFPHRRECRS